MKIAIDAFGGDNAPDEVVKGAVDAVKEYGVDIVLTGDTKKTTSALKDWDFQRIISHLSRLTELSR